MTQRHLPHMWPQRAAPEAPTNRADSYRRRARELIASSWRENDVDRKRYLFDLAKQHERAADAIAPLPQDDPSVFCNNK